MLCRPLYHTADSKIPQCYTSPYVRCGKHHHSSVSSNDSDATVAQLNDQGNDSVWTHLWNLHVHSKNTKDFVSQSCICPL